MLVVLLSQEPLKSKRPSGVAQKLLITTIIAASLGSKLLHYVFSANHIHGYPDRVFGLQRMHPCHAWITSIYQ